MMKLYLCGPIQGASDNDCVVWREVVKGVFPDAIDPMRRDYRGREGDSSLDAEIVELDKQDIRDSDEVLAYCPFRSVGTSMEIFYAYTLGKQVSAVVPPSAPLSPWLRYHAAVYTELKTALRALTQ